MLKKNIVNLFILLVSATAFTVGGVATFDQMTHHSIYADALECDHVGNHYSGVDSTTDHCGVKEYWVCCKCKDHFIDNPGSGTWTNNGTADYHIFDGVALSECIKDSRYIAVKADTKDDTETDMEKLLTELGFTYTKNKDGTYTITKYDDHGDVIVPEGVSGISKNAFKGNAEFWLVLPESIDDNQVSEIFGTGAAKKNATIYFVGTTTLTQSGLGCAGLYQQQGVNWDYDSSGTPTTDKTKWAH